MSVDAAYERLRKLQAVTEAALSHLDAEELLGELVVRVRDVLEADTCAVLLLDKASGELVARAAAGLEEEVERRVRVPLGRGFAGRIAAERRTVAIEDIDNADIVNPLLREKGLRSLLGAPLLVHDEVLGVIHVGTLRPRHFDEEDVELLVLAAERAARAVEKALILEKLMSVDELQRNFIALAAHELRNPAAVVHGIACTLHERGDDLSPEDVRALRTALHDRTTLLTRLIDQLLDLSRLEAQAIPIRPRAVSLQAELVRIAGQILAPNGERVAVDVPLDLEVEIDPDALRHVVSNLLANAFQYGRPPVKLSARQVDRHLTIAVEDQGEGVPAPFVPQLFDRFSRAYTTGSRGGAGLGLAIASSYAKALGGEVLYEQAQPNGARFQLVLPNQDSLTPVP